MVMRFLFVLFFITLVEQSSAQDVLESETPGANAQMDSLAVLLAEVPVDSAVAQLGDSLFVAPLGKARIIRDGFGVPHIYAGTDFDAAFAFGYAQAKDHLMAMLLNFRQAKGQLAEIEGAAALASDEMALRWRIHSVAGERYGDIPEGTRQYIEFFVGGINHYIEIHRRVLPHWVEDVRAVDVVALVRWILFLFAEQTGEPELALKGLTTTVPKLPGSNQWVVGPSRSSTGAPILAMDVQLPYMAPFQLYEAHLVSDEGLNVMGATFFGLPVIFFGHNDHIAWSMTSNEIDAFDLYEERLDPANSMRYYYEEEKKRMSSRRVKIRVRGAQGIQEVERELLYTDHGPVYKSIDNWAYAAHTSMEDLVDATGQLLAMNRAIGLAEFRQALSRLELPVFNVMYGDVTGEIFYVFNGRCPVRSENLDWRTAVPGWTSETEWRGITAFSRLPQLQNPSAGFLQNCNVAPDLVTVESGLRRDDFPPFLGWGGFNHRGQRILNWLLTHRGIGVGQMQQFIRDDYLIDAEELKGLILRAYNRTWATLYDPNSQVATAIHLLRSWDNFASLESVGALLFSTWKARFDPLLAQVPEEKRRGILVQEKIALAALRSAVEHMNTTYGRLDVPWGQVHQLMRGDQVFPMSGAPPGTLALHQTWTSRGEDGKMVVTGGSAFGMVVSLVQPVQSWSALAFGNSEDPESPHYSDQADLQSRDAFKQTIFTVGDLQPDLAQVTTVPFDSEEVERQALRVFWQMKIRAGMVPFYEASETTDERDISQ
jgi:acyl-homoserine-lactone acylase